MARVTHFEIAVDDFQASSNFYQKVFGWKVDKWEGPMDYWFLSTGDQHKPGIDGALSYREDLMNQSIVVVIDVDDAVGYMEKVKANGGEVLGELQQIPGVGITGYFKDPAGNILEVMQLTTKE